MSAQFEIRPLSTFTQAEIWPVISGYETQEIYIGEKTETDKLIIFEFRLARIDKPYQTDYYDDFTSEEIQRYLDLLPQGYSFGAYSQDRLVGFAISEVFMPERLLRIWEFHVMAEFRRMGIGRALMERIIAQASRNRLVMIKLETQNTNVKAIRFYRRMGFLLDAVDLSQYFYLENADARLNAFFMKRRLDLDAPVFHQA